ARSGRLFESISGVEEAVEAWRPEACEGFAAVSGAFASERKRSSREQAELQTFDRLAAYSRPPLRWPLQMTRSGFCVELDLAGAETAQHLGFSGDAQPTFDDLCIERQLQRELAAVRGVTQIHSLAQPKA